MDNFNKPKRKHKQPFVFGLLISFLSSLLVVIVFNLIVDPYYHRLNRFHGLNDYHAIYPLWSLQQCYELQKKENASVSIIGTSNVLHGISNCMNGNYERISSSAASNEATTSIGIEILQKRKKVIKICIELSKSERNNPYIEPNWLKRTLNINAISLSIATVKASVFKINNYSSCYIPVYKNVYMDLSKMQLNKKTIKEFDKYDILAIKNAGWDKVNKLKLNQRPKVVFFISPIPIEIRDFEDIVAKEYRNEEKIVKLVKYLSLKYRFIDFKLINLNKYKLGIKYQFKYYNFYDGWYDENHYKSEIGEQVFNILLKE